MAFPVARYDLDDVAAEFGVDLAEDDDSITHEFITHMSGHSCTCGERFRSQMEWARHLEGKDGEALFDLRPDFRARLANQVGMRLLSGPVSEADIAAAAHAIASEAFRRPWWAPIDGHAYRRRRKARARRSRR